VVVVSGAGTVVVGLLGAATVVLTDRDSAAGAPVPVAVTVTLCAAPSHGTGIRPTPVTGKPAAAGNG
jgi:hypothetical protein